MLLFSQRPLSPGRLQFDSSVHATAVSAFAPSSDVVAFDSCSPHAPAGPLVNAAASPDQSERGALQEEPWRGADTAPTRLQQPPYSAPLLDPADLASAPVTAGDCHRRPEAPVVIADHRTKFPAIHRVTISFRNGQMSDPFSCLTICSYVQALIRDPEPRTCGSWGLSGLPRYLGKYLQMAER